LRTTYYGELLYSDGYHWPEVKRRLGGPKHRWEVTIKIDLREIGWGGMDWIYLAQGRDQWRVLMNTVMNLRVL
jgi:hypothetical protein